MIKEFAIIAGQIYLIFLAGNNLITFFRYRQLPVSASALAPYLVAALLADLSSRWLFHQGLNNLFLLHIYTLAELLAWSYFYYQLFRGKSWARRYLPWATGLAALLIVANTLFLEPLSGFNSNAKTLVQLLLIGYAVYYFFDAFGRIDLTQPVPRGITFINFAVLLYYSGSLFIFMSSRVLADFGVASIRQHGFWAVNALLLVIFHLLIFTGLWTAAFRKTRSS